MSNWTDFFSAFWKGPGWFPGTERLGDITFVPENPDRTKYDQDVSPILHIYTITHFAINFIVNDYINSAAKVGVLSMCTTVRTKYCGVSRCFLD